MPKPLHITPAIRTLLCVSFAIFALVGIHLEAANASATANKVAAGNFEEGRVEVPIANLRAKPSTDSRVLGKLTRGAEVKLLLKKGQWYAVKLSDQSLAWGHEMVFQKKAGEGIQEGVLPRDTGQRLGRVQVPVGMLRERPAIGSPVISRLKQGDQVSILGTEHEWHMVELRDSTLGWAHQKLFDESGRPEPMITEQWNEVKEIRFEAVNVSEERVFFKLSHQRPPNTFSTRREGPIVVCEFLATRLGKQAERTINVEGRIVHRIRVLEGGRLLPTVTVIMDLVNFPGSDYQVQPVFFEKENLYTLILRRVRRE